MREGCRGSGRQGEGGQAGEREREREREGREDQDAPVFKCGSCLLPVSWYILPSPM